MITFRGQNMKSWKLQDFVFKPISCPRFIELKKNNLTSPELGLAQARSVYEVVTIVTIDEILINGCIYTVIYNR